MCILNLDLDLLYFCYGQSSDQLSFAMQKEPIGKKKEAIGSQVNLKEALQNKRKSKEKGKTLTKLLFIFFLRKQETRK